MSDVMRGVGLAHVLAEAFSNSKAEFGVQNCWTDEHINQLTTKEGKAKLLGPLLDVLRDDAEIVPKERVIIQSSVKPGDLDGIGKGVVVRNTVPTDKKKLVVGNFKLGVASQRMTTFYKEYDYDGNGKLIIKPDTHIDILDNREFLTINRKRLLPRHLTKQKLPGIVLRDFYMKNPYYIPECFQDITLFWGTICKNECCYYVPGIRRSGGPYDRRICYYNVVDGKDVLRDFEHIENDAVVFL